MPTVEGSLLFVSSRAAQVSEVWVRAPRVRTHVEGVVTTGNDRFPVDGGEVTFTAVPGPAVLALISQGRAVDTIPILVGDASTQTLRQVVSAAKVADDATQREIEKLAAQAVELVDSSTANAKKAQEEADRAEGAAGEAGRYKKYMELNWPKIESSTRDAVTAKIEAAQSAYNAAASERAAKGSATLAETAAGNAKQSESSAASSASGAKSSASAAAASAKKVAGSESTAARYATEAKSSASLAEKAAGNAKESESSAASSARAAKSDANLAAESQYKTAGLYQDARNSAAAAAGSASSAKSDADRAARIADSTSWDGDKLTVNGQTSPSLRGPKGDPGDKGEPGKDGKPFTFNDLTEQQRESLRGEPGRKGDKGDPGQDGKDGASTWADIKGVPSEFPPRSHRHASGDIVDAVNDAGAPQFGGYVIKARNRDGKIFYYNAPTEGRELANKSYVDSAARTAQSLAVTEAVTKVTRTVETISGVGWEAIRIGQIVQLTFTNWDGSETFLPAAYTPEIDTRGVGYDMDTKTAVPIFVLTGDNGFALSPDASKITGQVVYLVKGV